MALGVDLAGVMWGQMPYAYRELDERLQKGGKEGRKKQEGRCGAEKW